MTYTISKDFAFSASHQLTGLRRDHPCMRLHGHNYLVRVTVVRQTLDRHGFVIDYGDLAPFAAWIEKNLDHRHLNDVLPFQPTAEYLAEHLHSVLLDTVSPDGDCIVAVSETPKTWASWMP